MAVFADGALFWLYSVVVFSQFKPSEPFLVDFLVDVICTAGQHLFDPFFAVRLFLFVSHVWLELKNSL